MYETLSKLHSMEATFVKGLTSVFVDRLRKALSVSKDLKLCGSDVDKYEGNYRKLFFGTSNTAV